MKVVLAEVFGYCWGVRRAVDMVEQARQALDGEITTLGPIIHNPQVIEKHKTMGIGFRPNLDEIGGGTVVLSAHGVSPRVSELARDKGLNVIDATCPYVTKVHRAAKKMAQEGYQIVLVGDHGHTEVKGVLGAIEQVGGEIYVVSKPEEVAELPLGRKVGVVTQTTQTAANFGAVLAEVAKRAYEVRAYNTICGATDELQAAAEKLASEVEVVIVIGGRPSANTRRLRDICEKEGVPAYHIETKEEIQSEWLQGKSVVGVTAGASTPDWLVDDVIRYLSDGEQRLPERRLLADDEVQSAYH